MSRRVDRLLFILLTGIVIALLVVAGGCASFDAWATAPAELESNASESAEPVASSSDSHAPARNGELVVDGVRSVIELINPFAALGVGVMGSWVLAGARARHAARERARRRLARDTEPS